MSGEKRLTLMAVHAHPDDEVFGTGGVFARAADEGMRTVLVTATRGEEGQPEGSERSADELVELRAEELWRAVEILGIEQVYSLGYRDSGMRDSPANQNPENFMHADLDEAAGRVVKLIRDERPDVVVTYDERGGYGHPDHIRAHEVTTAAVEAAADASRYPELGPAWQVPKLYYIAVPRSMWEPIGMEMIKRGLIPEPQDSDYDYAAYMTPEELVTTRVDTSAYIQRKRAALMAHHSQVGNDSFLSNMPSDLMDHLLGTEYFIRSRSTVAAPEAETDLFAGLQ